MLLICNLKGEKMLKCSSQKNQTVALKKSDPTVFHQMHQAVPDVRVCVVAPPWITLTCRSVYNKNIVLILYKRKIKTRVWDGALQYVSTLAPQSRQKAQMSEFLFCSTDLNCIFFLRAKHFEVQPQCLCFKLICDKRKAVPVWTQTVHSQLQKGGVLKC